MKIILYWYEIHTAVFAVQNVDEAFSLVPRLL